ncbi:ABC transporter related protein [human gut metagenome]
MGLRTIKPIVTKLSNHLKKAKPNLIVSGLSYKNDKKYIFKDMNFSAAEGEVIGVLGNNGVGKTTLMRCLAGLIKEGDGKIKLNEIFLSQKKRNKACYMIMQDVNHQLFAESVWDECKLSKKKVEDNRVLSLLKEFNLDMYKENHPMALSGGQKQRLAIVTGILADKKILIFDEPTSGLDYENMCTVSRLIKSLSKEGHIIFIVTHDEEFLEITCDRVIKTCN